MTAIAWRRVSIALAWRPEWPITLLVGVCWLLLALRSLQGDGGHAAHASQSLASLSLAQPFETATFAPAMLMLASWLLMSFAMMVPATLPAVRHVAFNSIATRRARAMAIYIGAYLAVWVLFGVMALSLTESVRTFVNADRLLIAIVLAIAAAWQLTRIKRRAIVACRRTVPLPPDGLRADRACARFGVLQAWRCLLACWPLMLLMAVMRHPHPLLPTIALTLLVLAEERAPSRDRLILPIAGLFAAAALIVLVIPH